MSTEDCRRASDDMKETMRGMSLVARRWPASPQQSPNRLNSPRSSSSSLPLPLPRPLPMPVPARTRSRCLCASKGPNLGEN